MEELIVLLGVDLLLLLVYWHLRTGFCSPKALTLDK